VKITNSDEAKAATRESCFRRRARLAAPDGEWADMVRRLVGQISIAAVAAIAAGLIASPDVRAQGLRTKSQDKRLPPNTETMRAADSEANGVCRSGAGSDLPFAISVDGNPIHGNGRNMADSQRCTDIALSRADIQVRYDSIAVDPRLNVAAGPDAALRGDQVAFAVYSNYALWINRAEIRIFAKGDTTRQKPMAIVAVDKGRASWMTPGGEQRADEVTYVLRVYDHAGRFDETKPMALKLADVRGGKLAAGDLERVYGGNARVVKNIPVRGGSVVVSGRQISPGQQVVVLGVDVPVDVKGDFAFQQILSAGHHQVDVAVREKKGTVGEFSRSVMIPDNDWFYVGMADLTAGRNSAGANAAILQPDKAHEYQDKVFVNGRLAFYLKGVVKGEYLITAAADTREQPFRSLFSNFDSKDPRYLLRSLDPNKYYPVYGDDSTLVEDAPTRGKFFVRIEKGDNSVMWGNFKTSITGTEFTRYDRGLYGARAQVKTESHTSHGERRAQAEVFAAEPGTIAGRDVFRGTGGSSYFLRRQNLTQGTERVSVEVRDKNTGLVLKTRALAPSQDYEINYLQGRILLKAPLSAVAEDDFIVQVGTLSGHDQYIVVNYEYAPGIQRNRDDVIGGRASSWIGDHVEVGATGYDQTGAGRKQQLVGVDTTLRWKPGTYIKGEIARSNGPGDGEAVSIDGGFTFNTRQSNGATAYARRIEGAADLGEIFAGREGRLSAFWQHKDRDFSGPGQVTLLRESTEAGARALMKLNDRWAFRAKVDDKQDEFRHYQAGEANLVHSFNKQWQATVGVRADNNDVRMATASPTLNQQGRRTDGAVRLDYDSLRDWSTYVFGQVTLEKTGERQDNNRVGVGGAVRLTEKLTAKGEVSGGNLGLGAKLGTEYKIDENKTTYLTYAFDPDRTDILSRGSEGILVAGTRSRFSDSFSVFGEERVRHGALSGLTHAYGLDWSPWAHWKTGLGFEAGTLTDPLAGDLKRTAVSASVGYGSDGFNWSSKAEYRHDETSTSERDTWLTQNTLMRKVNPDWRAVGKLNASYSTSTLGDFYAGDFVEGVVGAAYRPVENDRLNALFKYTFFYDLPSQSQLASGHQLVDYAQRSHVLSIDASYDLNPLITVGGKYAFRMGDLKNTRAGGIWFDSQAHLFIGRVDLKVLRGWDLVGELRHLESETARDHKSGALIGVYKHVSDNLKIGGGYNFTDYSDSLTDLSYKNRGAFVNGVAKF
jgi:hypothetical protein